MTDKESDKDFKARLLDSDGDGREEELKSSFKEEVKNTIHSQ